MHAHIDIFISIQTDLTYLDRDKAFSAYVHVDNIKGVAHRMRSAAPRRAMSFKFEHIVFYVCTHTGGVIRRLSAVPSNDSERCSNSCRATERHRHCFILNNIIFVSNRC